jgi:hypothetical protein
MPLSTIEEMATLIAENAPTRSEKLYDLIGNNKFSNNISNFKISFFYFNQKINF